MNALIQPLRRVKHAGLALNKSSRRNIRLLIDHSRSIYSKRFPYKYDLDRYQSFDKILRIHEASSLTFKVNHLMYSPPTDPPHSPMPSRLFLLWTGDNDLSPQRMRAIKSLRRHNTELDVVFITAENLNDVVVQGHPLHPAYEKLSYVHRSDYLRAYLMHHHGGVYSDIKDMREPWKPLIDRANRDHTMWACGLIPPDSRDLSPAFGALGSDQRTHYTRMLDQRAFGFKPGSSWTDAWLSEVERRLSYFDRLLDEKRPQQPWGLNAEYPIPWTALLAQVMAPLSLKYSNHALIDPDRAFVMHLDGHR
ncbi:capsular biosynthesis protein [Kocuria sp. HSID16901]|nr:capsular biosynthesis protein [Kocuria sp. HSID16901]